MDRDGNNIVKGTVHTRNSDAHFPERAVVPIYDPKAAIGKRTPDLQRCCSAESVKKVALEL